MGKIERVVLYRYGLGLFTQRFTVEGNGSITLRVPSSGMNDVLKSLTVLDLGGGSVQTISYENEEIIEQRLRELCLQIPASGGIESALAGLQGAVVEVSVNGEKYAGRVLCAGEEKYTREKPSAEPMLSLYMENGTVGTFRLSEVTEIRPVDTEIRRRVGEYLELSEALSRRDSRSLTISIAGRGKRTVEVSYLLRMPGWKTSYRLLLPVDAGKCKGVLQGWAIIHNPGEDAWEGVDLTLISAHTRTLSTAEDTQGSVEVERGMPRNKGLEFFKYRIPEPITAPKTSSVLFPIFGETLECEKVIVFNPENCSKYPYRGVRIVNSTGRIIPGGEVTIIEANSLGGEAMLPTLMPNKAILVPYGIDGDCEIRHEVTSRDIVSRATIKAGDLVLTSAREFVDTYEVQNKSDGKRELVIEQPRQPERRLFRPRNPSETTEHCWRFRISVPSETTVRFQVETAEEVQTLYHLLELTHQDVVRFVSNQYLDAGVGRSLNALITTGVECENLGKGLDKSKAEYEHLSDEESRLLQNLPVLKDSDEEKTLRKRIVERARKLEEKIQVLAEKMGEMKGVRDEKKSKLEKWLNELEFEKVISPSAGNDERTT